ncbi:hypothetical protein F441_03440, partial [Phytophthora nicotianae CJ01A1]
MLTCTLSCSVTSQSRNNGSHYPAACKSSSTLRLGSHKRI